MLKTEKINNHYIASFVNQKRLNIVIAKHVEKELSSIFEIPNRTLILDMEGVRFIDSEGFNVLEKVMQIATDNNGFFKLCNVSKELFELFELKETSDSFMFCQASEVKN